MSVCLLALAAIAVLPVGAQAEPLSNAGKEFWLGFPSNIQGEETATQTLYITGGTATTGTVAIPGESFSETFSVTPGVVTSVRLPVETEMSGGATDGTEEKAIHVTAAAPVVVYGLNDASFTTDAYTGLPTNVIGTSYTVLAFGSGLGGNSVFTVVPSQNNTTVTITPSVAGGSGETRPAGVPYTITLNQGQEYQLVASNNPEDLTGTKITSSAPVSVFGGQECANIPTEEFVACDFVVEQNPPESTWGTSFLTEPLKTRTHGDDFQVVADQDETHVKLNGALVATLGAGQHYTQEVEGPAEWSADKAIQLAQYSNSSSYDDTTGDPFMITIPPYQQFETEYTITTPVGSETVFQNYVNLVVPDSAVGSVKVDGKAVPAAEFSPIGSSGFEGAQVDLEPGSHVLTGNGQPFGAFSYGFSEYNGYGYPGGFSLAPVATVTSVQLAPATETATVSTNHCVTATVTDQNKEPVPGVRVDFTVTGANSAEESVFAGSNGQAQFCYTGTNAGMDTISGAVGLLNGSAEKTWVEEAKPQPTSVTTSLSGGGQSGASISVAPGISVTDSATLSGTNASTATGSVEYAVYSDSECKNLVSTAGGGSVSGTTLPQSSPQTLTTPGTYYWVASYSGDSANQVSKSSCGSEVETVTKPEPTGGPAIDGIASAQKYNQAIAKLTTKESGDLVVAFVAADSPYSGGQTSTVLGGGLTWKLVGRENKGLGDAEVWVARASGVLTNDPITAKVHELSPDSPRGDGYDETITTVAFKNATGIGSSAKSSSKKGAATGSLTTTGANSWVWAIGDDWLASIPRTAGPSQTLVHQATDSVGDTYWVQSQSAITPTAGTSVTINDPAPTKDPFNMVPVEIL
ncbi:MAG: Ig-like domain-containing protein [Solirubrobacteraceae bacterium]